MSENEKEEVGSTFAVSSLTIMLIFMMVCLIGYLIHIYVEDYMKKVIN